MPNVSKKLIATVAIPIVFIAVALPIALAIVVDSDSEDVGGERSNPVPPEESTVVAGERPPPPNPSASVSMRNLTFEPDELEVDEGAPVVFLNDDNSQHRVTVEDAPVSDAEFDSGNIDPGGQSTWEPAGPGEYDLICLIHPNQMQLTVRVRPASSAGGE